MIDPDVEQQAILGSTARFNAIDGNAGAAKTTTLALKVREAIGRGLKPEDVLVLTYSPAAVLAFQQRLAGIGVDRDKAARMRITTFDALCHDRLQTLQGDCRYLRYPNREIHETVLRAIERARNRAEQHHHGEAFGIAGEGTLLIPALLRAFRHMKGTLALQALGNEFVLTEASALDAGLDFTETAVLQAYEALRYRSSDGPRVFRDSLAPVFRLVDDAFYDMACVLGADDPVFEQGSHPLRLRARLIMVDEGHDLNQAMFTVLRHLVLANPVEQVFVVGDRDQVVHSDGGADAGFMSSHFEAGIGPLQRWPLTTCRRFGDRLARPLGEHASKGYAAAAGLHTEVAVVRARTPAAVAAVIEGETSQGRDLQREGPAHLAVLLRHPGASVDLESALEAKGLHVETHGFEPFLQRPEVQFLRTLVAWASQSLDTLARSDLAAIQDAFAEFTGCRAHETTRGVRHATLAAFKEYFVGDPAAFARGIRNDVAVLSWADDDARAALRRFLAMFAAGVAPQDLHRRLQDLAFVHLFKNAFVHDEQVADAMAAMTGFARTAAGFDSFAGWLEGMAQREWAARSGRRAARRAVQLYSIPAAKGLEFDRVVMPDVDAGSFEGAELEERNLFYVGASRARLRLTMTFHDRPSSFLGPFGREADWDEVVGAGGGMA